MQLDKVKLKMLVANDLGADMEDRLEGELKTAHEFAGGASALKQVAAKVLPTFAPRVDEDEKIVDGMDAIAVRKLVKQYLTRACDFANHLGDVEQQKAITQGGRVEGLQQAMKMVQKVRDVEAQKLQQLIALAREEMESGAPIRTPGEAARAEHGSAADRKEEAKTAKAAPKKKQPARKRAAPKKKATKKTAAKG